MIQRCTNKNHKKYSFYGGRGITVCERWRLYDNFYKDMGIPPDNHQIDRTDNDKGYELSNCRWVTRVVNMRNKSDNRIITYKDKSVTLEEWGEITGIKANTILARVRRGWPINEALGYKRHVNKSLLSDAEKKKRTRYCMECGAVFLPRIQQIKKKQGKYCSNECNRKNSKKHKEYTA